MPTLSLCRRNCILGKDIPISPPYRMIWEHDLIPFELRRLFGNKTFLWGGDLNSAVAFDDQPWSAGGNRQLRTTWEEAGSLDLRLRFYPEEQRTFFGKGKGPYQMDHVFADAATERRVVDWYVDSGPATCDSPCSDHAPIMVVLEPLG
jgi:endonuclease/exonuclease/phosphatase family metal-dependent hydrolase